MKITKILALGWLIGAVPFLNVLFGQDSKLVDALLSALFITPESLNRPKRQSRWRIS